MAERDEDIDEQIELLRESFKITEKSLNCFLGIEVEMTDEGIFICQKSYIKNILKRFNMQDCKSVSTPMVAGFQVEESEADTRYPYRELVGALLYLSRCCRPDISYSVHYLSRFFTSYGKVHWDAGKRVLQYLQGTKDLGILYPYKPASSADELTAYVDADFAADKTTRKSTTGCFVAMNGAPVIWLSKKQSCLSMSSTEAEYVALSSCGNEAVWASRMYLELNANLGWDEPVNVFTDSQSAIKISENPRKHGMTKHIDLRYHRVRDLVSKKYIKVEHVPDPDQPADILTKAIVKEKFQHKRVLMGVQAPGATSLKAMCCVAFTNNTPTKPVPIHKQRVEETTQYKHITKSKTVVLYT